jgi:tetratricopeptide (TPR) repeat protein
MRFKGNSTSEARSQVSIVNEFLNKIPDKLMAYASIGAKAYPQALMHYEKYLKERERIADNGSASVVNSLRQIYGHLNDKDSMQVLIDGYSKAFTVDYEWLQYENEMRWDIAEISLREQVRKEPNRLSSYTNYLDCLQKAGEYGMYPPSCS